MTTLTNGDVQQQMSVVIGYIVIVIAAAAGFAFINAFASAGSPSSSSFLTYDNPEHHVKIEYQANWTAEEKNLELASQVVRIFPNGFLADRISP